MWAKLASLLWRSAVPAFSEQDMIVAAESAQRIADVVLESIKIVKASTDAATKLSRLRVAKANLELLKGEMTRFSFLRAPELEAIELEVAKLEWAVTKMNLVGAADGNARGIAAEKSGDIDVALAEYERLVDIGADTPHTYNRLAMIYRKLGKPEDEVRVIRAGLANIAPIAINHLERLRERLPVAERKAAALRSKTSGDAVE